MEELMKVTGYKRIHFGDYLITITCLQNCLYTGMAYNVSTDSSIIIDKIYAVEEDALYIIINEIKSIMIGKVHEINR